MPSEDRATAATHLLTLVPPLALALRLPSRARPTFFAPLEMICAMKRLGLIVVLAVALVGLLATPAFAGKTVPGSYPPTNIPIIVPQFGPGVWVYATSLQMSDISIWQASDSTGDFYKPIPKGVDVIGCVGYLGTNYGQVKNVPRPPHSLPGVPR